MRDLVSVPLSTGRMPLRICISTQRPCWGMSNPSTYQH